MSWTLRVRDKFQAAHYLKEYKGKCERVHGHSFQVEAVIEVGELDAAGIGVDFTEIKKTLADILPDHALLNEVYDFNPTAENLARRFYRDLRTFFPVKSVTVWESEDASATYAEDR
jgi:6-pyruvoyltetrahydropterin/6-carboxytetrahydropterin synthase